MKDKVFFSIVFGFIFGVLLCSLFTVNIYVGILLAVISLGIILFHKFISPRRSQATGSKNNWGIFAGIFVLAFSFGIFRFNIAENNVSKVLDSWSGREIQAGQSVSLSGMISDQPEIKEDNQKLIVEVGDNRDLKILITTDFGEEFRYGDIVNFYGKLQSPENFTTDTGKEFDYINYLKKDGILYVMSYPKIEISTRDNGSKIKNALFYVKDKFLEKINFSIGSPENLLMGGLILGEKSAFSEDLRQNFVDTGTIHIVALSGYNVTIVAEWIMKVFAFLPRYLGIGIGIFAILLFIIMTGASSTAIRAGVMAILALIARATGRNYDIARALILAGVVMIIFNPYVLVFDVSFQLSFIATIAVIFLAPKIEKYFTWITKKFQLRDIVSVTVAAYIFVLPFILYKMGNLSLVALPANVLILPFIPLTMLLGFITGVLGLIWYVFAVPAGFLSFLFLHYELGVINFFASLPFASFAVPNFPLVITLAIYAYFIYRLFGKSIKKFFVEENFN
ncbi:MAG: ComEC/Rec2 family competence protein [bacterium]